MIRILLGLFFLLYGINTQANKDSLLEQVLPIYKKISNIKSMSLRMDLISQEFLNRPYQLFSLGENSYDQYDQYPLFQLNSFDCETYVTSVLSLALASNIEHFKKCLKKIRYFNADVQFIQRKHFTETDWNLDNQSLGYIRDVTLLIQDKQGHSIACQANTLIDKPEWYKKLPISTIRSKPTTEPIHKLQLLQDLKRKGSRFKPQHSSLFYIPFSKLFTTQGEASTFLFSQIPNGAIIEIVRPNWQLKDKIGTNLNVSHMGLAFWRKNTLIFRHASSQKKAVIEVPLIDYLRQAKNNPHIRGINIQIPVPFSPGHC